MSHTSVGESADEVIASGTAVGIWIMEGIKERVMGMPQADRIMFYTAMLKVPVGCMKQSVGAEATLAILDTTKERLTNG
jgi:hypothetical protein